jgi:hypothetical protein
MGSSARASYVSQLSVTGEYNLMTDKDFGRWWLKDAIWSTDEFVSNTEAKNDIDFLGTGWKQNVLNVDPAVFESSSLKSLGAAHKLLAAKLKKS